MRDTEIGFAWGYGGWFPNGLWWTDECIVSRSASRDVVLQEDVPESSAIDLAYNLKRKSDITNWVRIAL